MKMRSRNIVARAAAKGQRLFLYTLISFGLTTNDIWKAVCTGSQVDVAESVVRSTNLDVWDDAYLNVAALNGHFELVCFLARHHPSGINQQTITLAIKQNQLATIQELLGLGPSPKLLVEHALQAAVEHRRLDILRWLCTQRDARAFFKATRAMAIYYCAPVDIVECIGAAWTQHVAMQRIRMVLQSERLVTTITSYQNGFDASTVAMNALCKDLATYRTEDRNRALDWKWTRALRSRQEIGCIDVALNAFTTVHLELLVFQAKLGFNEGFVWRAYVHEDLSYAAAKGHLNVIRFFHEHDYDGFDKDTIALAVGSGNLKLVQFLLAHRKESTLSKALLAAADKDKLDILRWLCDQPRASRYLEATMQQAETSASRKCIEYLATLPRAAKPISDECPLKRKATVLL
ncbi:hypothetical protein SDRG_05247, partial [Saprolegnia diclina VS20]